MRIKELIGDYVGFFDTRRQKLSALGIDVTGFKLSHLAYRTATYEEYVQLRDSIEKRCNANVENVWNGRPISKLLLREPLDLGDGFTNDIIELIPPVHLNLYQMGLEHVGIVVGRSFQEFTQKHKAVLTGQQFQSPICEPVYVRFNEDHTMVKFYEYSMAEVCAREGRPIQGFHHVPDWVSPE